MADELLTIDEVAAELKLHPDTIRRYIREKKLKSVRVGGTAIRVRRSEMERFIREDDEEEGQQQ